MITNRDSDEYLIGWAEDSRDLSVTNFACKQQNVSSLTRCAK